MMKVKSREEINKEIAEVKKDYGSVEEIIGDIADQGGRAHLVHRELRDFTYFVSMILFAKAEQMSNYDIRFKREYSNFSVNSVYGDTSEDLYNWACLYYIYLKWYENLDEEEE